MGGLHKDVFLNRSRDSFSAFRSHSLKAHLLIKCSINHNSSPNTISINPHSLQHIGTVIHNYSHPFLIKIKRGKLFKATNKEVFSLSHVKGVVFRGIEELVMRV